MEDLLFRIYHDVGSEAFRFPEGVGGQKMPRLVHAAMF